MIVLLIAFTLVVKIAIAVMMGPDPVVADFVMLIVSVMTVIKEFTLIRAVKIVVVKLMIALTLYKLVAPWLKLVIFVIGPVRLRVAVICLIRPNVWIGSVMHESAIKIHIKAFSDSLLNLVLFPA